MLRMEQAFQRAQEICSRTWGQAEVRAEGDGSDQWEMRKGVCTMTAGVQDHWDEERMMEREVC